MMRTRRHFIRLGSAAGAAMAVQPAGAGALQGTASTTQVAQTLASPVLRRELFPSPVAISSIDLIRAGEQFLVRVRSLDGTVGIAVGHPDVLETTWPILTRRIAPFFVKKDARDLEKWLEEIYIANSNYKWNIGSHSWKSRCLSTTTTRPSRSQTNFGLPVAGGGQESSLRRFRWMIEHRAVDVVQPDRFYFGGFIRSIRVARMAAAAGLACPPHRSDGGLGYLYVAHFASVISNAGPFQEYKGRDDSLPVSSETSTLRCVKGMLTVPTGPGLGVRIDPAFIAGGTRVS